MTDDECRREFEKWAEQELLVIDQNDDGLPRPLYSPNHTVWLAWQAAWQQSRTKPEGVDIAGFLKWLDSELVYIGIIKSQTKHGNDDFVKGFGEACADAMNNVEKLRRAIKQRAAAWHLTAKE